MITSKFIPFFVVFIDVSPPYNGFRISKGLFYGICGLMLLCGIVPGVALSMVLHRRRTLRSKFLSQLNPLAPNSDMSQISHCTIKSSSAREVMRIENMISQVNINCIDILPACPYFCKKCMVTRKENFQFDTRA